MSAATPTIKLNLAPPRISWRRVIFRAFNLLLFAVISTVAIFSALGYQPNFAAQSIEPTGLVELYPAHNFTADVYINGEKQDGGLPFRKNWVQTGTYTIEVKKTGYQTWSHQVKVDPNQRIYFPAVLMLYETGHVITAPTVSDTDLDPSHANTDGIAPKQNELWLHGTYLTRFSTPIVTTRWFSDNKHLVLQLGNQLFLADSDGTNLQHMATLSSAAIANFTLQDKGRILVYKDGGVLKAVELYEKSSLI